MKSVDECIFDDEAYMSFEMIRYMRQSCRLGIMGLESDGITPLASFNPNAYVTRAQFGTVLSRVLYGNTYDNHSATQWRVGHLSNLQSNNIITMTDPNLKEFRGWIMMMLYRTQ